MFRGSFRSNAELRQRTLELDPRQQEVADTRRKRTLPVAGSRLTHELLANLMEEFPTLGRGRLTALASEATTNETRSMHMSDNFSQIKRPSLTQVLKETRRLAGYEVFGKPEEQIQEKARKFGIWFVLPQKLVDEVLAQHANTKRQDLEWHANFEFDRLSRDFTLRGVDGLDRRDYGRGLQEKVEARLRAVLTAEAEQLEAETLKREDEERKRAEERAKAAATEMNGASPYWRGTSRPVRPQYGPGRVGGEDDPPF